MTMCMWMSVRRGGVERQIVSCLESGVDTVEHHPAVERLRLNELFAKRLVNKKINKDKNQNEFEMQNQYLRSGCSESEQRRPATV